MKAFDLKRFRKDKKMTQVDIAKLFDCKQTFISQIELGQKLVPDEKVNILRKKFGDIDEYEISKESIMLEGINPANMIKTGADAFTRQIIKMMNEHLIAPYSAIEDKEKEIAKLNQIIGKLEEEIKKLKDERK